MKRFYVKVRVKNLEESVAFYNALFATAPTVRKADYAKWMLEDPRINFAISLHPENAGIEYLGIQYQSLALPNNRGGSSVTTMVVV